MKKWVIVISVGLVVGLLSFLKESLSQESRDVWLKVGEARVKVEVRDTELTRRQGLSGWESLGEDEGMLFVFDEPGRHVFWMKGMEFDLDFVWVDQDKVIEITENVPASKEGEQLVKIQPKERADKVLEVNSGWVKRSKVKIGDEVILDN